MRGEFDFPTRIVFGEETAREIADLTRGFGKRALFVTGQNILRSGAVWPVLDTLTDNRVEFIPFDGVDLKPTAENVLAGMERYRQGCDFIIAMGGGSVMDAAKAIRLAASHNGSLEDFTEEQGGADLIHGDRLPPLVVIPTTAGTGSEVGRSTAIVLDGRKIVIFSPHLIPTLAICDPVRTYGMPPQLTAGTGADAMTHGIEAFFAQGYHPVCDQMALAGMRRVIHSLPLAVRDGRDISARSEMMLASLFGGIAFRKGLGVVHSLSTPLSAIAGVHHGQANSILLPHAVRFNRGAVGKSAFVVAEALGLPVGKTPADTMDTIAEQLERLFGGIGLQCRLRDVGVTEEMIPAMVEQAIFDRCHLKNPRPVTRQDIAEIYQKAL